jgi:uncharacterized protein
MWRWSGMPESFSNQQVLLDPDLAPGDQHSSADRFASKLRKLGLVGIVATLIIVFAGTPWLSAILVLVWTRLSRTPLRDIGYVRPKSWVTSTVVGVVFGTALKILMKALVMPLLGADPINHAYHYLVGNRAALPGMLLAVTIGAGFGEETFFRGFLFAQLRKVIGRSVAAAIAIVVVTSAWFALAHYPGQGLAGVEQAAVTGLVFGTVFAITGRIWMLMVAHAAFDVTAGAIIYWDLENHVAHILFK